MPGNAYAKTMWDPCPPGYRVMNHLVFASANICDETDAGSYEITGSGAKDGLGILLNESQKTKNGTVKADNVWFPFSGQTNSVGKFIASSYGEIFSMTPNNAGYRARSFRINSSFIAQQQTVSSMKESKPVRCIME